MTRAEANAEICRILGPGSAGAQPDYFADLNRRIDLEQALSGAEVDDYTHEILLCVWGSRERTADRLGDTAVRWALASAPAAAVAEAFLRAKRRLGPGHRILLEPGS
jgi:hypothetical protein